MLAIALFTLHIISLVAGWITYGDTGEATMTHYTMNRGFVAACGCTGDSTHYPTVAMSQMAYGSSQAFGPACGKCFNITLQNTWTSWPPFYPAEIKSIVVKVTDLCPFVGDWCNATESAPNKGGRFINFDLVYPSKAIPDDFFPSNKSLYGFTDFGVWNVSFALVSCTAWKGWGHESALGSVASLGQWGCCPAEPTGSPNDTCPSYSDQNGIPPDTTTNAAEVTALSTLAAIVGGIIGASLLV